MIDIAEFQSQKSSNDLNIFLNSCMKNIEYAKDQLAKKYDIEFFEKCLFAQKSVFLHLKTLFFNKNNKK
jgi:hypothetical protein